MEQLAFDLPEVSTFRKAPQPALGPAFSTDPFSPLTTLGLPGGASISFDLSKLTLADFRVMRDHPQINASLSLITFMLHQIDWKIECDNSEIASVVEDNLRLIWTRLVRALAQAFWAGYSPCIVEWENVTVGGRDRTYVTKIKDLIPEEVEVEWLEVEPSYRPPSKFGESLIVPKVKVFNGMNKWGLSYPIPVEHTFWYPLMMENGNYYGKKLLKPAFTPWYFSILIHLFANRYFERFGEPVPIGRAPFDEEFPYRDADGTDKSMTGKQAMERILMNLRNRGIVVLPSDRDETASAAKGNSEYMYSIEYLESQMRGADFDRYMDRLDEEMSLAIFTPMLLLRSASVGSHSLGVQHTQTWLWSLNALAGDIKEYIDRYLCERIKAVNFSPNAPRCEWVYKKMGKENPETVRAIISALISGKMARPNLEELGVELGLTIEEINTIADIKEQEKNRSQPREVAGPGSDTRERAGRVRTADNGPRRTGESMATGRKIAARIGEQVAGRWHNFSADRRPLSMGHRRMFTQSLVDDGMDPDQAETAAAALYSRMEAWLTTVSAFADEFKDAADFTETFARRLTQEIEDLAAE